METSFPTRRTCPLSITPRIVTSGTRKRRRTSSMHIETSFLALESALDHIASKQQGEGETDWLGRGLATNTICSFGDLRPDPARPR